MKRFTFQLTLGHLIFIFLCLVSFLYFDFYLGARLGPKLFWGISLENKEEPFVLPNEISDEELKVLLKEENLPAITFHDRLEKKTPVLSEPLVPGHQELSPAALPTQSVGERTKIQKKELKKPITLEVGSFKQAVEAEAMKKKLLLNGFRARIQPLVAGDGQKAYQIVIGGYQSPNAAHEDSKVLRREYGFSPQVIEMK